MRVLIAGSTGVVGRRLVPMLLEMGHTVVGMTRSPEKAAALRAAGAENVVADALDRSAVFAAMQRTRPDAVIHQLTAIPAKLNPRRVEQDFAATNRLRQDGTDYLLEAARAMGVTRFIAQSFGGHMRSRRPGPPMLEVDGREPGGTQGLTGAIAYLERVVPEAGGVVLRYGAFYGPGTALGQGGATLERIRARQFPIVGKGTGVWSFLHVDDAARAAVMALEQGAPGIYNVADDEPAAVAEWLPYLAGVLGAKPPRRIPEWLARLVAGENGVATMTHVRGIDNAKVKRELGWTPAWDSWREGFRQGL